MSNATQAAPASFMTLANNVPGWNAGWINAQHEYRNALQAVRDAATDALWEADSQGYIGLSEAVADPAADVSTRGALKAHISAMLDAGKFAEIDAIMKRVDEAEENYEPEDDEEEGEDDDDADEE